MLAAALDNDAVARLQHFGLLLPGPPAHAAAAPQPRVFEAAGWPWRSDGLQQQQLAQLPFTVALQVTAPSPALR
jgi:hypothetical protein